MVSIAWLWYSYRARGVDPAVFHSGALVQVVRTQAFISFTPREPYQKIVIFYPGALVQPEAYAPLCRRIAEQGYKTILMRMPWRLAAWGYRGPAQLGLLSEHGKQYLLAGHSQGAKMAAQFVHEHPAQIGKLILLGTTHPRDISLAGINIPVLKISGSRDGIASLDDTERNKRNLPATTNYAVIDGANHSQFGYYGKQLGDCEAGISREEQQRQVLERILSFIKE
jgi:alpha-beta hydrolase superfamily lysophospholipase